MPKRNLRVIKWLGTIPAVGVCTFCNTPFSVPLTSLKRVADAQESLQCNSLNTSARSAQTDEIRIQTGHAEHLILRRTAHQN